MSLAFLKIVKKKCHPGVLGFSDESNPPQRCLEAKPLKLYLKTMEPENPNDKYEAKVLAIQLAI